MLWRRSLTITANILEHSINSMSYSHLQQLLCNDWPTKQSVTIDYISRPDCTKWNVLCQEQHSCAVTRDPATHIITWSESSLANMHRAAASLETGESVGECRSVPAVVCVCECWSFIYCILFRHSPSPEPQLAAEWWVMAAEWEQPVDTSDLCL